MHVNHGIDRVQGFINSCFSNKSFAVRWIIIIAFAFIVPGCNILRGLFLSGPEIILYPSQELPSTFNTEITISGKIISKAFISPASDNALNRLPEKPRKDKQKNKNKYQNKGRHNWRGVNVPIIRAVVIINGTKYPLDLAEDGSFEKTVPLLTTGEGAAIANELTIKAINLIGISKLRNTIYHLREYVPHQLIVRFSDTAEESDMDAALADVGGYIIRKIGKQNMYLVQLPDSETVADSVALLLGNPLVKNCTANYIGKFSSTVPNDPLYNEGKQWAPDQIGLPEAWDFSTGDSAIKVCVIDTGVYFEHPDLRDNIYLNKSECCLTPPCSRGCWPNLEDTDPDSCPKLDLNGDGCPGECGVDEDGDGADFLDPQVMEIYSNSIDDDGDGIIFETGPGGVPCSEVTAILPGGDADQDCDGAARDDDENGYLDDCRGYDFCNKDNDPTDNMSYTTMEHPDHGLLRTFHSHGTHVSGILGAVGNNEEGVAGVNWKVKIMPLKIGDYPTGFTLEHALDALSYAGDNGCYITNNSYALTSSDLTRSSVTDYLFSTDTDQVLHVIAAGNIDQNIDYGSTIYFPQHAEAPNRLNVAATDPDDHLADFYVHLNLSGETIDHRVGGSNWGKNTVGVGSPGADIYSAIAPIPNMQDHSIIYFYRGMSGTSMAAAQVSGLAALILDQYPQIQGDPQWLRRQIENRVDPVPSLADKVSSGGRINACNSLGGCDYLGEPPVPQDPLDEFPDRNIIAAGWQHTCAITLTGGVKCWGRNLGGALGNGFVDQLLPVDVRDQNDPTGLLTNVASIGLGSRHSCALIADGRVKCWGANDKGQLGDGTSQDRANAKEVIGLTGPVKSLSVAKSFACALLEDGNVQCWGENSYCQLGRGSWVGIQTTAEDVVVLSDSVAKIAVGGEASSCVITDEGAALCWGGIETINKYPVQIPGLESGVASIAVGEMYKCALMDSNSVLCWGQGLDGRPGQGNYYPTEVSGLPGDTIVSLVAGTNHACVLTNLGHVYCWGGNQKGQLGIGIEGGVYPTPVRVVASLTDLINPLEDVVQITANTGTRADGHTCALTGIGQMKCWGMNHQNISGGQLGDGTTIDRPAPVDVQICLYNQAPSNLTASPPGGSYCPVTVTLTASFGNIHYTLDGTEPTVESPLYSEPIEINDTAVLKFMATDPCGNNQSETVTEYYLVDGAGNLTITDPVDGSILASDQYTVSGTADLDMPTVTVTSNQGHNVTVPIVDGNWSVTLTGVTPPSLVISAQGEDSCANAGCDAVSLFETNPCLGTPVGAVNLPADDGCHTDDGIEWWYYTGHLQTDDGRWFGFELVFFTVQITILYPFFIVVDVMMVHHAITDIQNRGFHYYESYQTSMSPQCVLDGFSLAYGAQTAVGGNGSDVIHGEVDNYILDLQLNAVKKPVLQYGDGYHSYDGMSTYYYSRERMEALGTLAIDGTALPVTGWAWFDHQYAVSSAGGGGVEWDWFAIQLDDYREIMIPILRDGDTQYATVGISYTDQNCFTTEVDPDDLTVTPLDGWTSPNTGNTYSMGWDVSIRNIRHGACVQDLNLKLTPVVLDQEVKTSHPSIPDYWEGAVEVSGDAQGRGYVEMKR